MFRHRPKTMVTCLLALTLHLILGDTQVRIPLTMMKPSIGRWAQMTPIFFHAVLTMVILVTMSI